MLELIPTGKNNIYIIVDEKFENSLEIFGSVKIEENKKDDKLVINRSDANLWIDELSENIDKLRDQVYTNKEKDKTIIFSIDCIIYFLLESNKKYVSMIDIQEMLRHVYYFLRDNSLINNYKSYITYSKFNLIGVILSNVHIFNIPQNLRNFDSSDFDCIYLNDKVDLSKIRIHLDETLKGIIKEYVKSKYNN